MRDGFAADSSVGVGWAVPSQSSQITGHLLHDVASGRPFVVPVLWMLEVANSLGFDAQGWSPNSVRGLVGLLAA